MFLVFVGFSPSLFFTNIMQNVSFSSTEIHHPLFHIGEIWEQK